MEEDCPAPVVETNDIASAHSPAAPMETLPTATGDGSHAGIAELALEPTDNTAGVLPPPHAESVSLDGRNTVASAGNEALADANYAADEQAPGEQGQRKSDENCANHEDVNDHQDVEDDDRDDDTDDDDDGGGKEEDDDVASGSDSDENSSSSASSEDDGLVEEIRAALLRSPGQDGGGDDEDADDDDLERSHGGKARGVQSKNELDLGSLPIDTDLAKAEEYLKQPDAQIMLCGTVKSILTSDKLLVIESCTPMAGEAPPRVLDTESVLCTEGRVAIGKVFETFGPVARPYYSLRFASAEQIQKKGVAVGCAVYLVPELSRFVLPDSIRTRGCDASNFYDEEIDAEQLEFSDDEAESAALRTKKNRKRDDAGGDTRARGGGGGGGDLRGRAGGNRGTQRSRGYSRPTHSGQGMTSAPPVPPPQSSTPVYGGNHNPGHLGGQAEASRLSVVGQNVTQQTLYGAGYSVPGHGFSAQPMYGNSFAGAGGTNSGQFHHPFMYLQQVQQTNMQPLQQGQQYTYQNASYGPQGPVHQPAMSGHYEFPYPQAHPHMYGQHASGAPPMAFFPGQSGRAEPGGSVPAGEIRGYMMQPPTLQGVGPVPPTVESRNYTSEGNNRQDPSAGYPYNRQ
ncbi:H/ACA ribonucleoprotein complex non-core subunit NAF1 [Porphyridium purpureum]|uniref:H/ACA ribonucleoprotein complex non-core subunit NAF1 n=1 Tax=Porphyridium purpureum TaxID=35688 RepID=A0A5J4Z561_PORPP|nr:H/ACA ribonucleoprotein complex non-core subunit NAF1 [Porphyridium purpureum]|eukprot:POR5533..scf295_1